MQRNTNVALSAIIGSYKAINSLISSLTGWKFTVIALYLVRCTTDLMNYYASLLSFVKLHINSIQIISLVQNTFNKGQVCPLQVAYAGVHRWQCNVKFHILGIYCKEHLYYVNQIHLKNIMANSSLLENKKIPETENKMKPFKYTFLSNALTFLISLKKAY